MQSRGFHSKILAGISIFLVIGANTKAAPKCEKQYHDLAANSATSADDPFQPLPHERTFSLVPADRHAGGSQGGRWLLDKEKREYFFAKDYGGSEERLIAEHLANQIYSEMGVKVPKTFLRRIDGKPYILSKEVPGDLAENAADLLKTDVKEHFVVDAWLANWDVLGQDFDNVIVDKGIAVRVDNGGSLLWRAQGKRKDFPKTVNELSSMRNPDFPAGEVYGELKDAEIAGQIRSFLEKYSSRRDAIRDIVKNSGLQKQDIKKILDALDARAKWLVEVALPKFQPNKSLEALAAQMRAQMGQSTWNFVLKVARQKAGRAGKVLTDGEILALDHYMGGDFDKLNGALRGNGENFDWVAPEKQSEYRFAAFGSYIRLAESALKKLPDFKGRV